MDFVTFCAQLLSSFQESFSLSAGISVHLSSHSPEFFQFLFSLPNAEQLHDCLTPTPEQDIPLLVISRKAPSHWQSQHQLAPQMSFRSTAAREGHTHGTFFYVLLNQVSDFRERCWRKLSPLFGNSHIQSAF